MKSTISFARLQHTRNSLLRSLVTEAREKQAAQQSAEWTENILRAQELVDLEVTRQAPVFRDLLAGIDHENGTWLSAGEHCLACEWTLAQGLTLHAVVDTIGDNITALYMLRASDKRERLNVMLASHDELARFILRHAEDGNIVFS